MAQEKLVAQVGGTDVQSSTKYVCHKAYGATEVFIWCEKN